MSRKKPVAARRPVIGMAEALEPRRLFANDFTVAAGPTGVVSADFNNDGRPDLATSNNNNTGATISILLGKADGTFGAATSVNGGATCSALVAGDFNADGKIDLAACDYGTGIGTNNLSILVGNGDGTFAARVVYSTGRFFPAAIVTGYFNSDADLDLAVANYNVGGSVAVLLGGAGATFSTTPTVYTVGDQTRTITTGDFNGDGKTDLATASNSNGTVSVLIGTGTGSFNTAFSATTGTGALGIASGDFNNDGRVDIATSNTNSNQSLPGTVSVLLNNGGNAFGLSTITVGAYPRAIVAADFNADGKVDLGVANQVSNTVSVRVNVGNGNLVDSLFSPTTTLVGPTTPGPSLSADFDNDGLLDLAVSSNGNPGLVRIFRGLGNGSFNVLATYTVGAGVSGIVADDFNGDGNVDLATSAGLLSGSVSVLLGVGNGTFAATPTLTGVTQPTGLAAGDFNGDGRADLAVCNYTASGTVQRWLGNGDGSFGTSTLTALGSGAQYPTDLASGDFNNDGRTDLATSNIYGPTTTALAGNADGTFTVTPGPTLGGVGYSVAFGEFTSDGKLDLVVGTNTNSGQYYVLPGNGLGGFAAASAAFVSGQIPFAMLTGDFNNDGKTDIAAANSAVNPAGDSQLVVLLGNGAGAVGALPPGYAAAGLNIAAGDFNGDGRLDLLGTGTVSTNLSLLLNKVPLPASPAVVSGVFTTAAAGQTLSASAGALKVTSSTGAVAYYNTSAVREYRTSYPLTVSSDLGRSGGLRNVAVTVNTGGSLALGVTQHWSTLTLAGGTGVALTAGRKLLRVKTINGLGGSYFDLNDSDLLYDYSGTTPQVIVRGAIVGGRNGGAWNGVGLTSTAAKNRPAHNTTLGFMEASEYKTFYGPNALFDGESIDSTAVLVRYTLNGDSDFNGVVDFNDFLHLQAGFGQSNTTFAGGNFDYNGVTDFNDFLALQSNFGAVL